MSTDPYRSELETLRAESERLREENESLRRLLEECGIEAALYPHAPWDAPCRLCGVQFVNTKTKKAAETTSATYEPAYRPGWFGKLIGRKPRPERIRRKCQSCNGVYYEATMSLLAKGT